MSFESQTFKPIYISRKEPLLFQPSQVNEHHMERFKPSFGTEGMSKITVKSRTNAFFMENEIKFYVEIDNTQGQYEINDIKVKLMRSIKMAGIRNKYR